MSNREPEQNSKPLAGSRVRHKRDAAEWTRLILISSIGLWLAAVIALPLGQIFLKATHAEFRTKLTTMSRTDRTVTELEIGTRTIAFGENRETVTIFSPVLSLPDNAEITRGAITVGRLGNLLRVRTNQVRYQGELVYVDPITIEDRTGKWMNARLGGFRPWDGKYESPVSRPPGPDAAETSSTDVREDRALTKSGIGTVIFGENRETVAIAPPSLPVPEDHEISHDGITVYRNGDYLRVTASRAGFNHEPIHISPIVVEVRGDDWFIDGAQLDADQKAKSPNRYIGFINFIEYFGTPDLRASVWNSIKVGLLTTVIAVVLAFLYAYGLTRTKMAGKTFFRVVAMLPLFAPTMLYGLSLVYLFGNKGVITTGFFEHPAFAWLAWDIGLYGLTGVVLAEVLFTFPPALMILTVALSSTDARLYEAASSLGASRIRIFFTVTLPSIKYGLMSAIFVSFTLSFTDFGAPKILGGKGFSVLAVDIYKQVVGQQNLGMGSTVSIILLVPAVLSFIADQIVRRRQAAAITAQSVLLTPKKRPARDRWMFVVCAAIASYILLVLFTAGYASLVEQWPYRFNLTLKHYSFGEAGIGAYGAYWNSIKVAAVSAGVGTVLAFLAAYFNEKSRRLLWLRRCVQFLAIIPLALPGLVIGIAYILFFNKLSLTVPFTSLEIPNPFNQLYGTIWILVIANIVHFFTVSFLTASTALRQLDHEFETVSESMSIPFYVTFFRVTVPVCLPAIIEIAMYLFVSSMATVSAVIFLYSAADTPLASVAVVDMADFGYEAEASAMCMLIVLTNIGARLLSEGVSWLFRKGTQSWRKR